MKLRRAFNSLPKFEASSDLWLGAATPLPGLVRRTADAGLSGLGGSSGHPRGAGRRGRHERRHALRRAFRHPTGGRGFPGRFPCTASPPTRWGWATGAASFPREPSSRGCGSELTPSSPERVKTLLSKVDAARAGQPKVKSAGCAFKNPPGDAAGRLIDVHGLKGLRVGGAMISHEHGNFVVNLGGAKADDVITLLKRVRSQVEVPLQVEWRLWGLEGTLERTSRGGTMRRALMLTLLIILSTILLGSRLYPKVTRIEVSGAAHYSDERGAGTRPTLRGRPLLVGHR